MNGMNTKPARIQTPHDDLTYRINGLAMAVHNELGPGFSEEIYRRAMAVGLAALHEQQTIAYLAAAGLPVALLIDFIRSIRSIR
jgi:hypothetical protein